MSLSNSGTCLIPARWKIGDWSKLRVGNYPTAYFKIGTGEPREITEAHRLETIVEWLANATRKLKPGFAFVEGYAFSRHSSSVTKLAELGGAARVEFLRMGLPLRVVTATAARKLLLGKLPPKDSKAITHDSLYRAGAPKEWCGDILDAFVIANYARTELGLPFLSLA